MSWIRIFMIVINTTSVHAIQNPITYLIEQRYNSTLLRERCDFTINTNEMFIVLIAYLVDIKQDDISMCARLANAR